MVVERITRGGLSRSVGPACSVEFEGHELNSQFTRRNPSTTLEAALEIHKSRAPYTAFLRPQ